MDHDRQLAEAFDGQAAQFELAPVQTDPAALGRLVLDAAFAPGAHVLDAGCGPGLVSKSLLDAGLCVTGVDLSKEMVERARRRCESHNGKARFLQLSVFDPGLDSFGPFDGAISRYVLHHAVDPQAFLGRQARLLKPAGILVACDHVTDPDATLAAVHREIEVARDKTHTRNLTAGALADMFAACGFSDIRLREEAFTLDFDEWFDRGTPILPKADLRRRVLSSPAGRGFRAEPRENGRIEIACIRATIRGVKPAASGRGSTP
jgi:SAM-dependent methyltransferase